MFYHRISLWHLKLTFLKWLARYEDLYTVDLKAQVDDLKGRLVLWKLSSAEHDHYSNYILPKHLRDYNFAETVEILKEIFGKRTSLFNIRSNCLKQNVIQSTSRHMQLPSTKSVKGLKVRLSGMNNLSVLYLYNIRHQWCWDSKENFIKNRTEPRHNSTSCSGVFAVGKSWAPFKHGTAVR